MNRKSVVVFVTSVAIGLVISRLLSPIHWRRAVSQLCSLLEEAAEDAYYPEFGYEVLGPEFTYDPWWERFDSKRTLYVAPYAQLGNTLQSIASAMTIAYRERINVKVPARSGVKG